MKIYSFVVKLFVVILSGQSRLNSALPDSALISIQPEIIGLYGMSSFNQMNARLSNGRAVMFFGAQGRSKYQYTPNLIYGLVANYRPWRTGFYVRMGVEASTLRTRLYIEDAGLSRSAQYPKAFHQIFRTGLVLGLGSSIKTKGLKGKSIFIDFNLSYILQFLNTNQNDYLMVDGKRSELGDGFTLSDRSRKSPDIVVYNYMYNFMEGQNDLNFYFGIKGNFKKLKCGIGLNVRLSTRKIGTLYTEYYINNQLIPGVQSNDITGTGIGVKACVAYPIMQ